MMKGHTRRSVLVATGAAPCLPSILHAQERFACRTVRRREAFRFVACRNARNAAEAVRAGAPVVEELKLVVL
jgi:hypothetical protein